MVSLRTSSRVLLAFIVCVLFGVSGSAQTSLCADCHLTRPGLPAESHVLDWDRSPHRRGGVGCERCHGGDPTTTESFLAHRDIVAPASPSSPIRARNIPTTCGACHLGPFVAFQKSRHFALLEQGETRGPTCVTCHGDTSGRVLSARALASRCNGCHGPNERAPRPARATEVRELYERLSAARAQVALAGNLIRRVDAGPRREQLTDALEQAQVPLTRAINAGHQFVFSELETSLALAQQRADALLAELANPERP
jgi:hypothetical protein